MRLPLLTVAATAALVNAAYPGDIVYYWQATAFPASIFLC